MIRKATLADCQRLAEIHVSGWRCAYADFIGEAFLFGALSVKDRAEAFTRALADGSEETWVYEEDSIIKGMLTFGDCRDEDKGLEAFELWGIYLEPFYKRRGIGRKLVDFCLDQALERGRREVLLWVFEKNEATRRFYEAVGFHTDGKRQMLERFNEYAIRYSRLV